MKISDYLQNTKASKRPEILSFLKSCETVDFKRNYISGEIVKNDEGKPILESGHIPASAQRTAMVSAAIIKRIENPKIGEPRRLSGGDIEEIIGIVSNVLTLRDAWDGEIDSDTWSACVEACRANGTGLNMNRRGTKDLSVLYGNEQFRLNSRSKSRILARKSQLESFIHASFNADNSRKANASLKKALGILESAFSLAMGGGTLGINEKLRNSLSFSDTATQAEKDAEQKRVDRYRAEEKVWFQAYVARGREAIRLGRDAVPVVNPVIR